MEQEAARERVIANQRERDLCVEPRDATGKVAEPRLGERELDAEEQRRQTRARVGRRAIEQRAGFTARPEKWW